MNTPAWAVPTGIPHLPNAACKGHPAHWWDVPRTTGQHHRKALSEDNQRALRICADCPARRACHELPGIRREDTILGGVAYGARSKSGQPQRIATAEQAAA